jgi:8-hydroxy-5-deazaflavin:NADPH oxidoreductase
MSDTRDVDRNRRALLAGFSAAGASLVLGALPLAGRAQTDDKGLPMRIGVIGAGKIGGAVGTHWAKAGHEVFFSSRHPEQLAYLVKRAGPKARAGTPREAAAFGDVLLISVPYGAVPQVGRDFAKEIAGKVVLETGNPLATRDGAMAEPALQKGTGLASAEFLPGARLVRAFTSVPAAAIANDAHRSGERVAVPLAGDDKEALEIAARLVREAGFEPVVVGGLASAKKFDRGTNVFGQALTAAELRRGLGI